MGLQPALRSNLKVPYRATVNAAGVAEIEITPTRSWPWEITQVSARVPNAPAGAACELTANGTFVTNIVASGDAATSPPPLVLDTGETALVRFTGCTPGAVAEVFLIYNELPVR